MTSLTKVFRFEAAHAIHAYPGACAHVHGHSYELHVTVRSKNEEHGYIKDTGILFDFKDLKSLVKTVLDQFDHKLLLSQKYLENSEQRFSSEELMTFPVEPTAENLLVFLRDRIQGTLPENVVLHQLRLWETRDSYAEWSNN